MPDGLERTRWPRYSEQDVEELCRVLREEQLAACDAPQVLGLQEDWARKIGVEYCYAVGAGTDALHMALWAAGVGQADEVLVPAYTFLSNALVVPPSRRSTSVCRCAARFVQHGTRAD